MKKSLFLLILMMFLISVCTERNKYWEEDLYGFYSWDGSVTELSLYNREDAPVYYLSNSEFVPVFRQQSHYSPFRGGGVYYESVVWSDRPNVEYKTIECDETLFEEAGVDISNYQRRKQIASTDHYTLYRMDNEIWVMELWRDDSIVISRLKKEDHYDFVSTIRDGEEVRLLRDLSDPAIPDITDPDITKKELMNLIGQTDDSCIVAYIDNAHIDNWYARYYATGTPITKQDDVFWFDEYRVMEYRDGALCSWLSYVFWDSPEHYEEAKHNSEWNFLGLQNDTHLMTCRIYSFDENLEPYYRKDFQVMNYDDMLAELQNNGYKIIQ